MQLKRLLEHLYGISDWVQATLHTDTRTPTPVTEPAYQLMLSIKLGAETLLCADAASSKSSQCWWRVAQWLCLEAQCTSCGYMLIQAWQQLSPITGQQLLLTDILYAFLLPGN